MRLSLLALLLAAPAADAQWERYELGRRLRRFEAEWERQTDPAARQRARRALPAASTRFLRFDLPGAARAVDDAYFALRSADPAPDAERWLDGLCVLPEKRAIDQSAEAVRVTVRQVYPVPGGVPAGATAKLIGPRGVSADVPLDPLPATVDVPTRSRAGFGPSGLRRLPRGTTLDAGVALDVRLGGRLVATHAAGVSLLGPLPPVPAGLPPLEAATAAGLRQRVADLRAGEVPETDLPAADWCDRFAGWRGPVFTPDRPGDHWLAVPTGKEVTPCRLYVPPDLSPTKPVPLVVALHGFGGSENLFFDGYGAGRIVTECKRRGWVLVAPRCGLISTPAAAVAAALRERYPIDPKRVFVVGHSMGAGQAAEVVQQTPGAFAGLAVLGGGGRVRDTAFWKDFPVFVGVGTADFAERSGRAFAAALTAAGAARVTLKGYPDADHLLIVREALPDVFAAWDEVR
jgi:predicted esterase